MTRRRSPFLIAPPRGREHRCVVACELLGCIGRPVRTPFALSDSVTAMREGLDVRAAARNRAHLAASAAFRDARDRDPDDLEAAFAAHSAAFRFVLNAPP